MDLLLLGGKTADVSGEIIGIEILISGDIISEIFRGAEVKIRDESRVIDISGYFVEHSSGRVITAGLKADLIILNNNNETIMRITNGKI
jgi:hypothetical protein